MQSALRTSIWNLKCKEKTSRFGIKGLPVHFSIEIFHRSNCLSILTHLKLCFTVQNHWCTAVLEQMVSTKIFTHFWKLSLKTRRTPGFMFVSILSFISGRLWQLYKKLQKQLRSLQQISKYLSLHPAAQYQAILFMVTFCWQSKHQGQSSNRNSQRKKKIQTRHVDIIFINPGQAAWDQSGSLWKWSTNGLKKQ